MIKQEQIKLNDSLHTFIENIDITGSDSIINCFVLEIGDKKIAIDNTRINIYQTVQDCETSFNAGSQNIYYIKDGSILGFSYDIDDFFSYYNYSYIFSVDDQMNQIYYDDFDDYGKGILKLIFSIAVSNFEFTCKANIECLNSLLYCKKENDQIYMMFQPIEDLIPYFSNASLEGNDILDEWGVSNHNELWEVIDETSIISLANAARIKCGDLILKKWKNNPA